MPTTFTICANNYLAHAKTLAVSYKKHHPDHKFIIAILDERNASINYDDLGADEIIWIHELFSETVASIKDTYSIAEICTVVKPDLFTYFFQKGTDHVLYIDPDIKVFSPFKEVFAALNDHDMVLTPHICSPTPEVGHPQDKDLMRTGIYNLGFLAVKNTSVIQNFVEWWSVRCKKYGFHDLKKGYFYDQIWLGYAPAFLDHVFVLRHAGYNMANWNLHERKLLQIDSKYFVNNEFTPLCFFHYSHFKMEVLPILASYNKNFTLKNRPDISPAYLEYKDDLLLHNYDSLKLIDYAFGKKSTLPVKVSLTPKERLKKSFKLLKKAAKMLIRGNSN